MSIETRLHERTVYPAAAGRSTASILCPFCGCITEARLWNLAGSGKKCECGAKHIYHPAATMKEVGR